MSKIAIIGGGPAGMFAAIEAAKCGMDVTIFEKNDKLGKKLFITGKGRCNVTNDCDADEFFEHINGNSKFLYSAFYSYDNHYVMQFFEKGGCRLKTERGNRVFPISDHSSDIIKVLKNEIERLGIKVLLRTAVKDILVSDNEIKGVLLDKKEEFEADKVIVATGGVSYPVTGSTGDGYLFAKKCGHTVTDISPALVPMCIEEDFCSKLQGLALKNVTASVYVNEKMIFSQMGEMLFTHFGVSGPLILSASSQLVKKSKEKRGILKIDLKPALSIEQLDKRLLRDFDDNKNKHLKNILPGLYPAKLAELIPSIAGIDENKPVNAITKEERRRLIEVTKDLTMTIHGVRDYNEAIITSGGISLKEINPSTMESKKVKGLYFAGEVLDLDAATGGFNLQIAWSTAALAGNSIHSF